MYNHLDMMVRAAEKNITIATTEDGLNRKMETLLPAFEKAKKRGVSIKIAAPITEKNIKIAKDLMKVAEVRDTKGVNLNGRFAIVDSNQLMFMLIDDKHVHPNYDVAVWLTTDYFAKSMEQMFNLAWDGFGEVEDVKSAGKVKGLKK